MIYLMIYLYDISPNIKGVLAISSVLLLIIFVLTFLASIDAQEKGIYKKIMKIYIIGLFSFLITSALIPSKDGMKLLAAAYVGEVIITNPDVQRIGSKSVDVLEKFLDEKLKEESAQ